ncbi:hypothetical protein HDU87_006920 [Geranomyces variabilis]|uniref:Peptidase M14 domain-containing protein n=1 Tax=Geranomyces variabilis TaxID=109894 RepID=A0AAD5TEU5_9FUNG|nr:hypothetical protein HDU87_006920 [Geranomyces variabilis]
MVVFRPLAVVAVVAAALCDLIATTFAAPIYHTSAVPALRSYQGHQLVQLQIPDDSKTGEILKLLQDEFDVWDVQPSHIDFRLPAGVELDFASIPALAESKIHVVHDNIQSLIDADRASRLPLDPLLPRQADSPATVDWFGDYHQLDEIVQWYQNLTATYPNLVTFLPSIGKTVEGRDIFAATITGANTTGATKPQFFFQGLVHAREWISGSTVQWLSNQLVQGYAADPSLLDSTEFIFVPVVNPDGYDYTWTTDRLWRKNRALPSGVDLNRNYDDHWGQGGSSPDPTSDTYMGPSAASEPETQAVSAFFLSFPNLVGAIDFHSYSQLVLRPYGWTFAPAPDETLNKQAGDGIAATILSVNQMQYVSEPSTDLYPTSGTSTDFWYTQRRIYSFCIELRPNMTGQGFLLDRTQIVPTSQEIWSSVLWWVGFVKGNPLPVPPL